MTSSTPFVRPGAVRRVLRVSGAVLLALVVATATAWARDSTAEQFDDVSVAFAEWTRTLDRIQSVGKFAALDPAEAERYREQVRAVVSETQAAARDLEAVIVPLRAQRDALGPAPGSDASSTEETADTEGLRPVPGLAEQRNALTGRIERLEALRRQVQAVTERAQGLVVTLLQSQRASLIERLAHVGPVPWSVDALGAAAAIVPRHAREIAESPWTWWRGLKPEQRGNHARMIRAAVLLVLAVAAVVVLRRWLLHRVGRNPSIAEPGYARRLSAAVIEGGGRGVFPALAMVVAVAILGREGALLDGVFADAIVGVLSAGALYLAAHSIVVAMVSPQAPAWGLIALPAGHGPEFVARARLLAAIVAVDVGVTVSARELFVSEAAGAAFAFIITLFEAAAIWRVADSRLWGLGSDEDDTVDDVDAALTHSTDSDGDVGAQHHDVEQTIWLYVRRAAQLVAIFGVGSQVFGYTELGRFVFVNALLSFGVVAGMILARGVLRETVGVLARSRLARKRLGLSARFTRRMKFWVRAALDPVLLIVAVYVILPLWGVPRDTMAAVAGTLTSELALGSVAVSPVAIVTGIFAFFVFMMVIRILRGRFLTPILSETRMDAGAREALSTGVGYAGVVIALLIGVTVAGFDLTNLAIVAGALSVGIGFGLQNTVNNFLSGLILLVERPIKVGDWVVVGQIEGFVKEINFRATEIETWQLASVMVPNGDVISTAVTNWTHRDKRARVEVRFGVSYEADFERVREIALECGRAHARALSNPEPNCLFMSHAEDRAIFELRVFTGEAVWMMFIASDLRLEITKRLKEAGIAMPLPRRIIHAADDNVPRVSGD